jgi:8-amino-7-oxononanoate synthase
LIVGSERIALALAEALQRHGILALPIRPPTVPAGRSRLRFAFAAQHRAQDIDHLVATLASLRRAL